MSDNDLIRRGDALQILDDLSQVDGCFGDAHEAIAALPAVLPAPDAAAIREAAEASPNHAYRVGYAAGRAAALREAAALMTIAAENCRKQFTYPPKTKEQRDYQTGAIIHSNAAAAILALILKGGDNRRVYMGQIMAECDCPREAECQAAGRCIAEGKP